MMINLSLSLHRHCFGATYLKLFSQNSTSISHCDQPLAVGLFLKEKVLVLWTKFGWRKLSTDFPQGPDHRSPLPKEHRSRTKSSRPVSPKRPHIAQAPANQTLAGIVELLLLILGIFLPSVRSLATVGNRIWFRHWTFQSSTPGASENWKQRMHVWICALGK